MRVLFVSKPVMPPWNDGSKNLVRDVVANVTSISPTVMVAPGAPSLGPRVVREPVYGLSARFAPNANTLVLNRLLFGPPLDAWQFVFAPNVASSSAARVAIAAQRARGWRGPVVQVVASRPKDFGTPSAVLFGDRVVVLSEWTRERFARAGVAPERMVVIPPCAGRPEVGATAAEVRARWDLGDGPLFLYPGDLEFSTGARTVARAAPSILARVPGARLVFACRPKTPRAAAVQAELERDLAPLAEYVRFVGEVTDMASLVAAADVVLFPVDELYGKVDLPLVLLEALALGRRVVVAGGGPLPELSAVTVVPPRDPDALAAAACEALGTDPGDAPRLEWERRFRPEIVAAAYDALYA